MSEGASDLGDRQALIGLMEERIRAAEASMSLMLAVSMFGPVDPNRRPTPVTRVRAFWRAWVFWSLPLVLR